MTDFHDHPERKQIPIRQTKSLKRILTVEKGKTQDYASQGKVIASYGKTYIVEYGNSEDALQIECFLSGKVITPHSDSSIIAVGDDVSFITNLNSGVGSIMKIEQRRTFLSRLAVGKNPTEHVLASNVDYEVIIQSVVHPSYNRRLIDRMIIAAEMGMLSAALCINKIDLFDDEELRDDFVTYINLGIPVFYISAYAGDGFESFRNFINGKKCVFTGPSGSGKSTILNKLLGAETQVVGEVSRKTTKGKHTTSATRMLKLEGGGVVIDTPGIREYGLWGIIKNELHLYFHDFDEISKSCRYYPCTHTHEPGCSVPHAVENGLIDPQRYESYLNLFESIEEKT